VVATFHESYYSTAATVIPLFLFLIVFETRSLNVRPHKGGRLFTLFMELIPMPLLVALFVSGEWVAIVALRDGRDPAHWKRELLRVTIDVQLGAILLMGVLIVLSPITGGRTWFPAMRPDRKRGGEEKPDV
jgi:hypothetical protein